MPKKRKTNPKKRRTSVPRTRNGGEWTESMFWGAIRSALRGKFKYWGPAKQALLLARRQYKGPNKLQKWEFKCAHCKEWYKAKEVQVDHIIPVGSLRCYEDLVPWIKRLVPENIDAFQVLCKKCHDVKTKEERK